MPDSIPPRSRGFTMLHFLLLLAAGMVLMWWWSGARPVARLPGVLVAKPPLQEPLAQSMKPFEKNGFKVEPLAQFALEARVLSRADYHFDTESDLAPTDLALGWGRMSDSAVLDQLDISQSGRWFRWSASEPPIPENEITISAANMHLIPATPAVERALSAIRAGQIVSFSGYLVKASRPDGWHWNSSLSRSDSGGGACELVWVERLSAR